MIHFQNRCVISIQNRARSIGLSRAAIGRAIVLRADGINGHQAA
jgi:DNA transposition AAA+ family ATPase